MTRNSKRRNTPRKALILPKSPNPTLTWKNTRKRSLSRISTRVFPNQNIRLSRRNLRPRSFQKLFVKEPPFHAAVKGGCACRPRWPWASRKMKLGKPHPPRAQVTLPRLTFPSSRKPSRAPTSLRSIPLRKPQRTNPSLRACSPNLRMTSCRLTSPAILYLTMHRTKSLLKR